MFKFCLSDSTYQHYIGSVHELPGKGNERYERKIKGKGKKGFKSFHLILFINLKLIKKINEKFIIYFYNFTFY